MWLGGLAGESAWEFGATEFCLKTGDSPALVLNASAQCDSLAFAQSQRPSLSSPGNAVWPDAVPPSPSVRAVSLTAPDFPLSQSAFLLSMRSGAQGRTRGTDVAQDPRRREPACAGRHRPGGLSWRLSPLCVLPLGCSPRPSLAPSPPSPGRAPRRRTPATRRGPGLSCGSRSGRH